MVQKTSPILQNFQCHDTSLFERYYPPSKEISVWSAKRCYSWTSLSFFSFMHSFFPDSIKSWNNIGNEFTSLSPISQFKRALLAFIRPVKKSVFGIHNPVGIKRLFQLRLGLSDLKRHKKYHNFEDTPSDLCVCNLEAKNTQHFFCRCSLFSIQRRVLVHTVSDILSRNNIVINNLNTKELVKIYLYGDSRFNDSDNQTIILATVKFITDSNRLLKKDDWQYFMHYIFLIWNNYR